MAKRSRKPMDPAAAMRKALKAGAHDVIDHLLVDAPPCAPDDERIVDPVVRSDAANALALAMKYLPGDILLDWNEQNVAAIIELGGEVVLDSGSGPGEGSMRAFIRDPSVDYYVKYRVHCACYAVPFVESREHAKAKAPYYKAAYEGWDEPPPPPKTAEQLAADAKQAKLEAAERAAVLAAELELATEEAATRATWNAVADAFEAAAKDAA